MSDCLRRLTLPLVPLVAVVVGCVPDPKGPSAATNWHVTKKLPDGEASALSVAVLGATTPAPAVHTILLDRLRDMCVANAQILARAGVDVLVLDDDVGMPTSMIISRGLWARYIKPRVADIIAAGRAINSDLLVLYHSDGWILPIVDELIEIGVNALNPIQPNVVDPAEIKRRFGDRITLWGAVGTQATFSDVTPEGIRRETRMRLETLGPDRLVLCPAYDLVESDRLWPNIEAFLNVAANGGF